VAVEPGAGGRRVLVNAAALLILLPARLPQTFLSLEGSDSRAVAPSSRGCCAAVELNVLGLNERSMEPSF